MLYSSQNFHSLCIVSRLSATRRRTGGTHVLWCGLSQASITGYEVQQLRHGEWTAVVEAEQLINDQLRRFKRERRHLDSDVEEPSRLRKRLLRVACDVLRVT